MVQVEMNNMCIIIDVNNGSKKLTCLFLLRVGTKWK